MKNFKSLMLAAMAALACIALPSCSDDDDSGDSRNDFVGIWQEGSTNYYHQYNSDGTGLSFGGSPESHQWEERFAWRIKNGILDIDYDLGDWTDIEHHEYRFSDNGNTLEVRYIAKTKGDNYKEVEGYDWETYHKAGSKSDEEDEPAVNGTVSITNITAQKKTSTGLQINVTVSASGISASDVKGIGAKGGTSSNGNGSLYASLGSGKLSGTVKITSGLKSKTKYYIKAYLTTKDGTVYSAVRSVTTP